jgi:CheY-like chemotaxis protein
MTAGRVLLIDQDADWCARVCRFLESHGMIVATASDISHAAGLVATTTTPDAVVMDIAMRDHNSRAVAAMRELPALSAVPFGFVNKTAALDLLLLILTPGATDAPQHRAA